MTNKRVLKAESALDVIKIINDEIGVEGTFGLQDARLSLMSPNGHQNDLETIYDNLKTREWRDIIGESEINAVLQRMDNFIEESISCASDLITGLDRLDEILAAWLNRLVENDPNPSLEKIWREVLPHLRFNKYKDFRLSTLLAYITMNLKDWPDFTEDTTSEELWMLAGNELGKIRSDFEKQFDRALLQKRLSESPYSLILKITALLSGPSYLDKATFQGWLGSDLPQDWDLELELSFMKSHFDCSYVQETPWSDLPNWLVTILAKLDTHDIIPLAIQIFTLRAKWCNEVGLVNRIVSSRWVERQNTRSLCFYVDEKQFLELLTHDEAACFVDLRTRLLVLSSWLQTGKKVVEITPQSHHTLFDVCANRVENDLSPVRFEDQPLPGDKYFKETICFKFSNVFCRSVANCEHLARQEFWSDEYEWLGLLNMQLRRYLAPEQLSAWPNEKSRPFPVSRNFGFPLAQIPNHEVYVFITSESMILDEKVSIAVASRPARPVWSVARTFDWKSNDGDFSNPLFLFTKTGPSDSETDHINSAFVQTHNWLRDECSCETFDYDEFHRESASFLHRDWKKEAAERSDEVWKLAKEAGYDIENPELVFGFRPKQNWILADRPSEFACIAANALAAMNKDVKVTYSQNPKRKGKRGARGSRSKRSKTLRLDEKGLRTYSKSVRRNPKSGSTGNRRGKKMGIQNVDGHSYRVWVVSPRHGETVLGRRERTGKKPGFLYCVRRREGVRGTGYVRGEGITVNPYRLKRGIDDLGLPTG